VDAWQNPGIREVLAVPRQQVLYSMVGHGGYVKRIDLRCRRQDSKRHDRAGNLSDFRSVRQQRNTVQQEQAVCRKGRVTRRRLVDDIQGRDELVVGSFVISPSVRQQLSCRGDHLRTRLLPQVADDRCFDVNRVHRVIPSRRAASVNGAACPRPSARIGWLLSKTRPCFPFLQRWRQTLAAWRTRERQCSERP